MVALNPLLLELDPLNWLLRDADGNVRAAMVCWGLAIGALVTLRPPRQVVLACLFAATVTVDLAALVVEVIPVQAIASAGPSTVPSTILPRSAPNRAKPDIQAKTR